MDPQKIPWSGLGWERVFRICPLMHACMHAVLEFATALSCQLLNVVLEGQAVEYRLQPFLAV